jgi:formamidopyrimidine-DNA glycosylase
MAWRERQSQLSPMPELPEVDEAAGRLRAAITGKTLMRLDAHHASQKRHLPRNAARKVEGLRVEAVERRGKHQLVRFAGGSLLHVHFRMDGDWVFSTASEPLPRFARVSLDFHDGLRASLTDPRALCTVRYHSKSRPPALDLGPEADDPALTAEAFRLALKTKRGPIKPVLLDQRLIAGIGNIYAAESLWRAAIHPQVIASTLSARRASALLEAIRASLREGVVNAGRYRTGDRILPLKVYDREGEPCERCGKTIKRITQSGRSTYFCASCQRR